MIHGHSLPQYPINCLNSVQFFAPSIDHSLLFILNLILQFVPSSFINGGLWVECAFRFPRPCVISPTSLWAKASYPHNPPRLLTASYPQNPPHNPLETEPSKYRERLPPTPSHIGDSQGQAYRENPTKTSPTTGPLAAPTQPTSPSQAQATPPCSIPASSPPTRSCPSHTTPPSSTHSASTVTLTSHIHPLSESPRNSKTPFTIDSQVTSQPRAPTPPTRLLSSHPITSQLLPNSIPNFTPTLLQLHYNSSSTPLQLHSLQLLLLLLLLLILLLVVLLLLFVLFLFLFFVLFLLFLL